VVVKIFAVILLLLVMEITFLSTQEPITFQIKEPKIAFSDVTFEKLDAALITTEGVKGQLRAERALSYKDRNELYKIDTEIDFKDHTDYLKADKAIQRPDILHFMNNIVYDSNHTLLLKSDDLVYNIDTDIAISHTPFILQKDGSEAEGTYLEYHAKERYVKANDVIFTIEEKE
jgi:hypothetical protein